jgi:hypothetical protein
MIGCRKWQCSLLAAALVFPGLALLAPASCALADESTDRPAADDARIADLIERLGAEEFNDRERAQNQLAELGLEAFDALHTAQNDNDPEISLRARHLVRSMNVRWFQDTDPPEAVKILRGYGDQPDDERKSRIDHLARLDNRQGIVPLCRLARFETVDVLSKGAALKVMEQEEIADAAARAELAHSITAIVGNSKRPAATWLRL